MAGRDRSVWRQIDDAQVRALKLALGLVKPKKRRGLPVALPARVGPGWLPLAPKELPDFGFMLDDIGAGLDALAAFLDVPVNTVLRWSKGWPVPRACLLALYWMTEHGRRSINDAGERDAAFYGGMVLHLMDCAERQSRLLAGLGAIADFGSANDPSPQVVLQRPRPGEASALKERFDALMREAA